MAWGGGAPKLGGLSWALDLWEELLGENPAESGGKKKQNVYLIHSWETGADCCC